MSTVEHRNLVRREAASRFIAAEDTGQADSLMAAVGLVLDGLESLDRAATALERLASATEAQSQWGHK